MPANLTAQYREAEAKYKSATSPQEQLVALQGMLREIPKHKGTEKMQADIKKRIARLRKQSAKPGGGSSGKPLHHIDREGVGQVIVCGAPNSGKSRLVGELTQATPEVTDYPFTTRRPTAGMMKFEDVQIQLVDTPPLAPETLEAWQMAQIANADIALLLFDVNDPLLLDQTDFILAQFQERGLDQGDEKPRTWVLGNKVDRAGGRPNFDAWNDLYGDHFQPVPFSIEAPQQLTDLRRQLFTMLDKVRVYTKRPRQAVSRDDAPFVLKRGASVLDAAASIHKDLVQRFQFAKVWNSNLFEGQRVEKSYLVQDGDIVEIHSS